MIPADLASRLRLVLPEQPAAAQPALPTQKLTDALSDLVPGQRVMAEIQAMLPNGTYRAVVGQREVTLALPFAAKAGDTLELEVTESDGKLSLAFVTNRSAAAASQEPPSAATTLSRAGQLIGDLLGEITDQGKPATPAPLNGNKALVDTMPATAAELVPVLKKALAESGMFYEAHQARWAAGQLPTENLMREPQGMHSARLSAANIESNTPSANPPSGAELAVRSEGRAENRGDSSNLQLNQAGTGIPKEIVPLVQQQLDALANQNYTWQGQAWPGQNMWWEINEQQENAGNAANEPQKQWQTRLKLDLPNLGGVDASLRLRADGTVDIRVNTLSEGSEATLKAAGEDLRQQLEAAGIILSQLRIHHEQVAE